MNQEQLDRLLMRLKGLIIETQKNPKYQTAMRDMLHLLSRIKSRIQTTATQLDPSQDVRSSASCRLDESQSTAMDHILEAEMNAKSLIENFSNGYSLAPMFDSLYTLVTRLETDQPFRFYLDDLNKFIESLLLDPAYVESEQYTEDGRDLARRGRLLVSQGYTDIVRDIFNEIRGLFEALRRDKLLNELSKDWAALASDLFLDENGVPTVKPGTQLQPPCRIVLLVSCL
jgi:hypothetical protein